MNTTMIVQENDISIKIDSHKGTHWITISQENEFHRGKMSILFSGEEALDKFMYDLDLAYELCLTKNEGGENNEG